MFRKSLLVLLCAAVPFMVTPAAGAATWKCTTSADSGSCGPWQDTSISNSNGYNTYVLQDVWNASSAFKSQTLNANTPGSWQVTATAAAGNLAVLSYPDTQQVFTLGSGAAPVVNTFSTIFSDYTSVLPSSPAAGSDYESAYDIWLHDPKYSASQWFELMIWTHNHGQRPAGNDTGKSFTVTQDGVSTTYEVWVTSDGAVLSLVQKTASDSQREHLLSIFNWLANNGYVSPANQLGIWQIDYGVEICSTAGTAETFALTRYAIGLACTAGSTSCYSS